MTIFLLIMGGLFLLLVGWIFGYIMGHIDSNEAWMKETDDLLKKLEE